MMAGAKASKSRTGYMTTVSIEGVDFAIFSPTTSGLERAFISATNGRIPFDNEKAQKVKIQKHV